MNITANFQNGRLRLHLSGDLDHHGAKGSMAEIDGLIDRHMPRDTVMDLSGLTFMDSSGIAILLRVHKRMQSLGGRAWVENPAAQPLRVIDASGIDRLVHISTTSREGS